MNKQEREKAFITELLPADGIAVQVGRNPLDHGPWVSTLCGISPRLRTFFCPVSEPLPRWCEEASIRHIHLLDLCMKGGEVAALRGAATMLQRQRIDMIRFEYGPHFREHGESLFELASFLLPFDYFLLQQLETRMNPIRRIIPGDDPWTRLEFLALAPRFVPLLNSPFRENKKWTSIDMVRMFALHGITPRGVVHVGAHHGEELPLYKKMGFQKILFVEANPKLAESLRRTHARDPSVHVASCAASDADGEVTLRVTSDDLSSSILPLKMHATYYPTVKESRQIKVPGRRLDTLLRELNLSPRDFNFLHLDIQGAELLALKGAPELLAEIDAIATEINFEELYEGCGLFTDLDDYLVSHQLKNALVTTPYHPAWGDAFYVRPKPENRSWKGHRGTLSMSTLGSNGRFGNQLFQYMFLRLLAHHHQFAWQAPPWIGQFLFGHADPPITAPLQSLREGIEMEEAQFPTRMLQEPATDRDLWGYFQFDTVHLAPHRPFIRSLFKSAPDIEQALRAAWDRLRLRDAHLQAPRPVVALHIRRGDFVGKQFFSAPTAWYRLLLEKIWPTLSNPLLYIASDEPAKVLPDFKEFAPVSDADLGVTVRGAPYFPDFFALTQANVLGISNSSFSFFAAMLNEQAPAFYRPNLYLQRMVAFDPWNAAPLLHRELGTPLRSILRVPPPPPPPGPRFSTASGRPLT